MANRNKARRLLWVLVSVLVLGLAATSAGYGVALKRQADEAERLAERRAQLERQIAKLRTELAQPLPSAPPKDGLHGGREGERAVPASRQLDEVLASLHDIVIDTGITFVSLRVREGGAASGPAPAPGTAKETGNASTSTGSALSAQGTSGAPAPVPESEAGSPGWTAGQGGPEAQWAAFRQRYGLPERVPIVPTEIVWTFDAPWDRVDDVMKRLEALERVVWVTAWTVLPPDPEEESWPLPNPAPAPSSGDTMDDVEKAARILRGEPLRVQLTMLVFHAPATGAMLPPNAAPAASPASR